MKTYSLLSTVFCLMMLLSETSVGQEHILFQPIKYQTPHRDMDTRPVRESERDDYVPWFVISVNQNAQTYSSPGRGRPFKQLVFGERFYVTAEEGNYLRIAKDDRRNDFHLSSRAEDYGWVSKNDVLMWQRALMDPESAIALKGMILNTTSALGDIRTDYHRINAYKDSELNQRTDFEARLFEIFYIYRYSQDGRAVLLGRSPHFSERQTGRQEMTGSVIGWVDLNRVLEWDHRVAVEPNHENESVSERFARGIRSTVFTPSPGPDPKACARQFMRGHLSPECEIAWQDDIFDERGNHARKQGYWRRFPVIGDHGSEIYKLMVMGELYGETGIIEEEVDMEVRRRLNQMTEKLRNINVVFAVDGTNSMGPYYRSVVNAIERIVQLFEAADEQHKNLKFGYVIYRDYLEGDRLLETRQLTPNSQLIMDQLRRVDARDYHDIYVHEAVNYGLRAALSQVFVDPDETNILIHLGDAGNHSRDDPSQVPQSEIVRLMAEYKCYYIAYQVHHMDNHQAYDDFPRQIREIMSRASEKLYYEWVDILGENVIETRPYLRQVGGNIYRIEGGPPMALIASDRGREMDLTYLEDEISRAIEEIDAYTDRVVEITRELLERGGGIQVVAGETEGTYVSSFAPGVYNFLVRLGLDEETLQSYYETNVQFVFEGYASRTHASLNRPLFTPVLLLQAVELSRIINRLERLRLATHASGDRRDLLYDAWVELLRRHVGIRPDGYFDEISLEEASMIVFGVPMRSSMLQQIQLKDIHDVAVFPNTDLNRYINQIEFKSRQLDRIVNTRDYEYSFNSNDILYYWIDVDYLP